MPELLTPPVERPSEATINDTRVIDVNTVIAANEVVYGVGLRQREFATSNHNGSMSVYIDYDPYDQGNIPTLTNHGTIWNYQPSTESRTGLADYGIASPVSAVINTGIIAVENENKVAYVVFAAGHSYNSGWLYGYSATSIVTGYASEDPFGSLTNDGFIAVHSLTATATGVIMDNGGTLTNGANGVIQAAGANATGVVFNRGAYAGSNATYDPQIVNQGLIEAISLDPNNASIGIFIQHLEFEWMEVVNSGTIRADFAIYASGQGYSPLQQSTDRITNTSTGVIEGAIYLAEGDDILINDGLIQGNVLLDDGDDLFDTRGGRFEGFADLGFGNDTFLGSAFSDYVRGETGNDWLEGNGGNDLLIGDWGSDTLIGGAGNDGLYGEFGNDRIVTLGGDFVAGGSGNDRLELGDYSFAMIDGETGDDTLVLAGTGRLLDLAAAFSTGRLANIEHIELGASDGVVLRAADIAGLTGGSDALRVSGVAGATAYLVGSWSADGTETVDGAEYAVYRNGAERVLVAVSLTVNIGTTAPAGAVGLDAVEAGDAAPLAGIIAGSERYTGDTFANFFALNSDFEIDASEYWYSAQGNTVLAINDVDLPSLLNSGSVVSISDAAPSENNGAIGFVNGDLIQMGLREDPGRFGSMAVYAWNAGTITNSGLVYSETTQDGTSVAFFVGSRGAIENNGEIYSIAVDGTALGISTYDFSHPDFADELYSITNHGEVYVRSENGHAIGFWTHNSVPIYNDGLLQVSGGAGAWGYIGTAEGTILNDGTIVVTTTAEGGTPSVAFRLWMSMPQQINNSGTIIADQLIENWSEGSYYEPINLTNSGLIDADITFWQGRDIVRNSGQILGAIDFGLGNDTYYNEGGTVSGLIAGGGGIDTAHYQGTFGSYTVHEASTGQFTIAGAFGTEVVTGFETLQFADITVLLDGGEGIAADPSTTDPDTFMLNIRDYDGNDLGGASSWELIGQADADGDGDGEYFYVNREIGRFAEVGVAEDGRMYFDNHGQGGDTRVVGIYIDPLVQSGQVEAGGDFDSQRRFQNDLFINNIAEVLGAGDYDGDGLQEVYFALTDGTAYLHAYMHADGNIQYANYQSQQEVIDFLTANGFGPETYADWFPSGNGQETPEGTKEASVSDLPDRIHEFSDDVWQSGYVEPEAYAFAQFQYVEAFA